jgi:hypothetical protein
MSKKRRNNQYRGGNPNLNQLTNLLGGLLNKENLEKMAGSLKNVVAPQEQEDDDFEDLKEAVLRLSQELKEKGIEVSQFQAWKEIHALITEPEEEKKEENS